MSLSRFQHGLFVIVALCAGCTGPGGIQLAAPRLTLHPGEAAQLQVGMRPGQYHMIEVAAAAVGPGGAELVLGADGVEVPPIYFPPDETGGPAFDARLWSPVWPTYEDSGVRVANYGPDSVTLERVRARTGGADALYGAVRDRLPRAPAWSDIKALQEHAKLGDDASALPPEEIAGARAWMSQQRRRLAFEAIQGPPIPVRMAEPIRGNVEVRSCAVGAAGALVGFSRPDATRWIALGPGWYPSRAAAKWKAIPADKGLPRGFEWETGKLLRLAVYLADPRAAEGRGGAIEARLFRLDSAEPVVEARWYDIGPAGRWFELVPEESQAAGLYVIELRAITGAPVWLTWNAEPVAVPGAEFPRPNETLVAHAADPVPDFEPPIDVHAHVMGSGDRIEMLRGGTATPGGRSAGIGREIVLRAKLAPGETEIHYIQNYRSPVPARAPEAGAEAPPGASRRRFLRFGGGV